MNKKLLLILLALVLQISSFAEENSECYRINVQYKIYWSRNNYKVDLIIALPKTIEERQIVSNMEFSPLPQYIFSKNNCTYAHYIFPTDKEKPGSALIAFSAKIVDLPIKLEGQHDYSPFENDMYLSSERYVSTSAIIIKKAANQISYADPIGTVEYICDYLNDTIKYKVMDSQIGAEGALEEKIGDCTEFADTFASIARIKNIPTRLVTGYSIENDKLYQHNWAEIYTIKFGWIGIEPLRKGLNSLSSWDDKVILSYQRNDPVLRGNQFYYCFASGGGCVAVEANGTRNGIDRNNIE